VIHPVPANPLVVIGPRLNVAAGIFHLVSGVAVLLLSNDFALPVTGTFLEGPPGSGVPPAQTLFDLPIGPAVAVFFFLSAGFHLLVASPVGRSTYERELAHHRNLFRWVEYSLSASLMVVLIALLPGIGDVAALVALFGVNASMILFGWLMETGNDPADGRPVDWTPFWMGCVAGAVPWLAIGVYLWAPGSSGEAPAFVYAIFVTLFVFFNSFAVNQFLQYRKVGRWTDYLFGERVYIVLSFTAKSALAWQVFANTLVG